MPRPFRRIVTIPAGGTWPEQEGTVQVAPFWWLRVGNRGVPGSGNDIWVSLLGPLQQGDKPDIIVAAGSQTVENIGGPEDPPATSLHLKNVGTAAVDVQVETSTAESPIIHLTEALAPSSSAAGGLGSTDVTDRAGRSLGLIGDAEGPVQTMQISAQSAAPPAAPTANGYLDIPCANMDGVQVTYDGTAFTGTCTLAFYTSIDGAAFFPTFGQRMDANVAELSRACGAGRFSWLIDAPGATHVRVIATVYTAGGTNPTLSAQPSSAPMAPQTVGALAVDSGGTALQVAATNGGSIAGFVSKNAAQVLTLPNAYDGSSWQAQRAPTTFKPQNAVAIAAETTVWTPAAGKKFRLMGGEITSSVTGNVVLRDNTAGTILAVIPCIAGQPTNLSPRGNGQLSAAANNVLTATGPAASTLSGNLFGTEE